MKGLKNISNSQVKLKVYEIIILHTLLYGCEFCVCKQQQKLKILNRIYKELFEIL